MCNCTKRMQKLLRDGVSVGNLRLLEKWHFADVTMPDGSRRRGWHPPGTHPKKTDRFITVDQTKDEHFTSLLRRLGVNGTQ